MNMVAADADGSRRELATDTTGTDAVVEDAVVSVRDLDVMFRRGVATPRRPRVSFDVMPAEIVGIVGESGSGKSVLGLSLLGLLPRDPAPPGYAGVRSSAA